MDQPRSFLRLVKVLLKINKKKKHTDTGSEMCVTNQPKPKPKPKHILHFDSTPHAPSHSQTQLYTSICSSSTSRPTKIIPTPLFFLFPLINEYSGTLVNISLFLYTLSNINITLFLTFYGIKFSHVAEEFS